MAKFKNKPIKMGWFEKISTPLCAVLFFLAVCWSANSTVKEMAVVCVILALAGGIFRFSRLRDRINIPVIALSAFVLMGGISTFYAVSGKFALQEFLKVLISFCLTMFMLATTSGEGVAPGRKIASVLEGFSALAGVVSIDLLSTRLISNPVLSFLGTISNNYTPNAEAVQVDTRMLSMFVNSNVFACITGIATLLSLGLVLSSEKKLERCSHLICLFINALSFVLAFSMGGTAFLVIAFLVYLFLEHKERLASLFFLMLETLLLVVAAIVPIYLTSFKSWDSFQPIPMACVVIGCAALCLLDRFVGQILGKKLAAHSKIIKGMIAGVLVIASVFVLFAYNLTGPITVQKDVTLHRAVDLEPGDYTLSYDASGSLYVTVYYQNTELTLMHTYTILYDGYIDDAAFTVPDDSLVVHFNLYAQQEDILLESLICEGNTPASVPLGYKLLPGFIANRIQGLWANNNAALRTEYFRDGLKLFQRSPLIGLGMGSFENAVMSVQDHHYETKYAHNHYIQTLAETGIIGFILFLTVLGSCFTAVLFERKKDTMAHPLTAALGAALIFIAGHAFVEINFSYYASLPILFATLGLTALCCGDALPIPRFSAAAKSIILAVCGMSVAIFTVFLFQNMNAAVLIATQPNMENMKKAAEMDKFEYVDYMISYVVSASQFPDDPVIQENSLQYAEQLAQLDSNIIPYYLADFYFSIGRMEQGFAMLEKYVLYVASDSDAWNQAFDLLVNYADFSESFTSGLKQIVEILNNWNATNMGSIVLNEQSCRLLEIFKITVN